MICFNLEDGSNDIEAGDARISNDVTYYDYDITRGKDCTNLIMIFIY